MVRCLIAQTLYLCFNNLEMSSEKFTNTKILEIKTTDFDKKNTSKKIRTSVDINSLIIKLREKEKLQKHENLLFIGIISSIIVTMGIIGTL
jgi:hypothetical protein